MRIAILRKKRKEVKIGPVRSDIPSKPYRYWFLLWNYNVKQLESFSVIDRKYLAINGKARVQTKIMRPQKCNRKTPISVGDSSYLNMRFTMKSLKNAKR